ncbi:MAG: FliI/YscN family ATPase [Deltaproteobacteria bacterium]|nr:FliI/YscN family ATPase [Deltaproteobacteria bacterium]
MNTPGESRATPQPKAAPKAGTPKAAQGDSPRATVKTPPGTPSRPNAPGSAPKKAGGGDRGTPGREFGPLENFAGYRDQILNTQLVRRHGRVLQQVGEIIEAYNPGIAIGALCAIYNPASGKRVMGEVVGFRGDRVLLMSLEQMHDLGPHCRIIPENRPPTVPVGPELLGRVLNGLGEPIDALGEIVCAAERPLYVEPINPLHRRRIEDPIDVGIRSINGLLTCGQGQRMGIMSGSGVGKSVTMGMMARHTTADVNVIALIGERGREVVEFIQRELGPKGMERSVLVVATSDQPPLVRTRAAHMASTIAEYFREQGLHVLFMMDSVTRFAMAMREIGLAAGEPPATKGYPPSVFSALPKLLERAGLSNSKGSVTGFYTVLVEGDDLNDPIADAVRAIVDGHIVLSRELASRGQYPAVDVSGSISRVMTDVVSTQHKKDAQAFVSTLATYKQAEDLINIGAYVRGSNRRIDYALAKIDAMTAFLKQPIEEDAPLQETELTLHQMFADYHD